MFSARDEALAAWRAATAGAAQMQASHLDELETHLRDTFAELREIGLPEEEAFHLARRRLGDTELAVEFAKVHPDAVWRERGKWMLCGLLGYQLLLGSIDACSLLLEWAITSFFPAPVAVLCVYWASAVLMIGASPGPSSARCADAGVSLHPRLLPGCAALPCSRLCSHFFFCFR